MSKSNSPFIEGSKHGQMSSDTEAHFGTAMKRSMPGAASGKSYQKYGDSRWNSQDVSAEFYNNETGFNYKHNGAKGSYPRG